MSKTEFVVAARNGHHGNDEEVVIFDAHSSETRLHIVLKAPASMSDEDVLEASARFSETLHAWDVARAAERKPQRIKGPLVEPL